MRLSSRDHSYHVLKKNVVIRFKMLFIKLSWDLWSFNNGYICTCFQGLVLMEIADI